MLVDSCSFELICVLVDQYVIQYFLVCQYLCSSLLSPFVLFFYQNLERRASGKVKKPSREQLQVASLQQEVFSIPSAKGWVKEWRGEVEQGSLCLRQ